MTAMVDASAGDAAGSFGDYLLSEETKSSEED